LQRGVTILTAGDRGIGFYFYQTVLGLQFALWRRAMEIE